MASNDREIERKYLLRCLPSNIEAAPSVVLDQGYLPGERIQERIRRTSGPSGRRYYRTIKMGSGVDRFELEEETTEMFFLAVWPLTRGRRVQKRRYTIAAGSDQWVVDDFVDRALVLAEIELERADQPISIPPWLAEVLEREVTDEPAYTNFMLAR